MRKYDMVDVWREINGLKEIIQEDKLLVET